MQSATRRGPRTPGPRWPAWAQAPSDHGSSGVLLPETRLRMGAHAQGRLITGCEGAESAAANARGDPQERGSAGGDTALQHGSGGQRAPLRTKLDTLTLQRLTQNHRQPTFPKLGKLSELGQSFTAKFTARGKRSCSINLKRSRIKAVQIHTVTLLKTEPELEKKLGGGRDTRGSKRRALAVFLSSPYLLETTKNYIVFQVGRGE